MTRGQMVSELITAAEGMVWFDNEVEEPEEYSQRRAYFACKTEITERVANAIEQLRADPVPAVGASMVYESMHSNATYANALEESDGLG